MSTDTAPRFTTDCGFPRAVTGGGSGHAGDDLRRMLLPELAALAADEDASETPPAAPERRFDATDLAQAKAEAWTAGHDAAEAAWAAANATLVATALADIAAALAQADTAHHAHLDRIAVTAAELAVAGCHSLADRREGEPSAAGIVAALAPTIAALRDRPRIEVEIGGPAAAAAAVEAGLAMHLSGFDAIQLHSRPELPAGHVTLRWRDGWAELDPAGLRRRIDDELRRLWPETAIAAIGATSTVDVPADDHPTRDSKDPA